MKHLIFALLVSLIPAVAFGQQAVTVVDQYGNISTYSVRTFDTTPKVVPIKPYGLNLQPADIPDRVSPYSPSVQSYNPGPVTIENPYFRETVSFPEQENDQQLESLRYSLLILFKRIFRIP